MVGRFAEKYPKDSIAELYRLTLDAEPPLSIRAALSEILEKRGVEINDQTARAYVRNEKRRRRSAILTAAEPHQALDDNIGRLVAALDIETDRVIGAANGSAKPIDVKRVRELGQAIKELRAALGPSKKGTDPTSDPESGSNGKGEASPVVAELLAAHSQARTA